MVRVFSAVVLMSDLLSLLALRGLCLPLEFASSVTLFEPADVQSKLIRCPRARLRPKSEDTTCVSSDGGAGSDSDFLSCVLGQSVCHFCLCQSLCHLLGWWSFGSQGV